MIDIRWSVVTLTALHGWYISLRVAVIVQHIAIVLSSFLELAPSQQRIFKGH